MERNPARPPWAARPRDVAGAEPQRVHSRIKSPEAGRSPGENRNKKAPRKGLTSSRGSGIIIVGNMGVANRRLAPWGKYDEYFRKGGDCMDELFLRLLCRMVEIGAILSFRVTKDKVYIIIKK